MKEVRKTFGIHFIFPLVTFNVIENEKDLYFYMEKKDLSCITKLPNVVKFAKRI